MVVTYRTMVNLRLTLTPFRGLELIVVIIIDDLWHEMYVTEYTKSDIELKGEILTLNPIPIRRVSTIRSTYPYL